MTFKLRTERRVRIFQVEMGIGAWEVWRDSGFKDLEVVKNLAFEEKRGWIVENERKEMRLQREAVISSDKAMLRVLNFFLSGLGGH